MGHFPGAIYHFKYSKDILFVLYRMKSMELMVFSMIAELHQ